MTRIGLLSDTHGYLDENIFTHFKDCDEIWHAGDFGDEFPISRLSAHSRHPLKGVYGNVDSNTIRIVFPEQLLFVCEEVKVMMRHIGGSPPNYNPATKNALLEHQPQLFISGHSHILKIIFDPAINCLHMNPGAAGKHGWHKMRTIIRFVVDGKNMKDCEVIELGKR